MSNKELEKLSAPLREQRVTHLLLVRMRKGVTLSSIANGDDLYEFFQVLAETQPIVLEIMQDVIDSRRRRERPEKPILLN